MQLNDRVPLFDFQATNGLKANSQDYQGKWLILYFYPKDNTPGCTLEGKDFQRHYQEFVQQQAVLFGISRDSLASHERFKQKQGFAFELISDETGALCQLFGVLKVRSLFGKEFHGIERSTFLINPEGKLHTSWRKIRIKGHAEVVLQQLRNA
jgi:peroxiredoxin Q/BCP